MLHTLVASETLRCRCWRGLWRWHGCWGGHRHRARRRPGCWCSTNCLALSQYVLFR